MMAPPPRAGSAVGGKKRKKKQFAKIYNFEPFDKFFFNFTFSPFTKLSSFLGKNFEQCHFGANFPNCDFL